MSENILVECDILSYLRPSPTGVKDSHYSRNMIVLISGQHICILTQLTLDALYNYAFGKYDCVKLLVTLNILNS